MNILNLNNMTALDKLVTLQLCRHLLICPMLGDIDEPLNLFQPPNIHLSERIFMCGNLKSMEIVKM